jgi:hypothetical protein
MPPNVFVFECSTNTYMECIEKGVFGSNVPWPLQVAKGDYCLLRHYEVGTVFALWRAESDGGRKLVPRAWGGRFPFQARVALVSPEIIEVPTKVVEDYIVNPATGRGDNVIDGERAEGLIQALRGLAQLRET